jgi:cell division protein FtsB
VSRRRRPSRSSLVLRWASILVFVAIALAYVRPFRAYLHGRAEVGARRAEVAKLAREKRELSSRLAQAGTDEFVVREARMLGLVRPGEHLYIVKARGPGLR